MTNQAQFAHWVPVPVERVFLFFANPGNLPRIMPPQTGTELLRVNLVPPAGVAPVQATITDAEPVAGAGSEIVTSFRIIPYLPFRARWIAFITEFEWNHHFADVQRKGPFRRFHHRHEFAGEVRDGVKGTLVRDLIEYEIGFGVLGSLAHRFVVGPRVQRIFEYRQKALQKLLN